jgi:hypothetical protein
MAPRFFKSQTGDIYPEAEGFENSRNWHPVSPIEAAKFFAAQGADLDALGLADYAPGGKYAASDVSQESQARTTRRGRPKSSAAAIVLEAIKPETEQTLAGEIGSERGGLDDLTDFEIDPSFLAGDK